MCFINIICFLFLFAEMSDTQEKEIPAAQDEPFLGTVDIILLVVLLIGAIYWLLKRNKKEEKPVTRSYAIQ